MTIPTGSSGSTSPKHHLDVYDAGTAARARRQQGGGHAACWPALPRRAPSRVFEATGSYDRAAAPRSRPPASPTCASTPARARDFARAAGSWPRPTPSTPACSPAWAAPCARRRPAADARARAPGRLQRRRDQLWRPAPTERTCRSEGRDRRNARQHLDRHIAWIDADIGACEAHRRPRRQPAGSAPAAQLLRSVPGVGPSPRPP